MYYSENIQFANVNTTKKILRIIIAGSRSFNDYTLLTDVLKDYLQDIDPNEYALEFISGGARGADNLGEVFAIQHEFPLSRFYPAWRTHGKAAGILRNKDMLLYAKEADKHVVIVFWDGQSKGTKNMINLTKDEKSDLILTKF